MRRVLATLLLSCVVGATSSSLWAQDESADAPEAPERPAAELVRDGNARFADGALDEALGFYDRAHNQAPDSAELAFNRGLTHFKIGNLDQAGDILNRAVGSSDRDVEANSKFMLGNVQHLRAVQAREQDPAAAIDALEQATRFYVDALAVQPENEQLRANIELAQNLMQLIREEQQQQEQEQEQQQDQEKQEQEQQEQQDQEQQQQDGEEQDSEQAQDQEQKEQQQQEQEQDQEKQDDQNPESEEQDQESEEQENQEGKPQDQQEQEQKSQESSGEQDESKEGREQQSPQPSEAEEGEERDAQRLPPEQIERMLQQIRDKERARRQQKAEQARRQAGTVKKDW